MTGGGYTLDSFQMPQDIRIGPVGAGETRFTRLDAETGQCRAFVRNSEGEDTFLLPMESDRWWCRVPLFVLQLDQGKVGAAGAAFLGHASVIIRQLVSLSALSIFLQDMLHFGSVCVGY